MEDLKSTSSCLQIVRLQQQPGSCDYLNQTVNAEVFLTFYDLKFKSLYKRETGQYGGFETNI